MAKQNKQKLLGVFSLSMINTAAIVNLNNLPSMAVLGYALISYLLIAAVFFFLPTAFVSAELATGWPQSGGFYTWVRMAFGPTIGFLAIWLQWAANVIWYPTLISPIVDNALTVFAPSLVHDRWILFAIMVGIFWLLTWINLQGLRDSSFISTFGVLLGSIFPAILFIIFAVVWLCKHLPIALHFQAHELIPRLGHLNDMSILVSVLVTLVGMEMSSVHANNVRNPRTAYPRAAVISALIILVTFMLTSLAMSILVPPHKIDLINGVIQCLESFSAVVHVNLVGPILILIILGVLAMASTWILGPSRGLQVAAINGEFPEFFAHKNKRDVPSRILCLQGILYTLISSLFVFVPSVASSYWILIALTGELYMLMYFILFFTGLRLRYKYPQVVREYTIPGRWNSGMWLICLLGIVGTVWAFIITFFPPTQFSNLEGGHYVQFLLVSFSIICLLPLLIFMVQYYFKRRQLIAEQPFLEEQPTDLPVVDVSNLPLDISE